MGCNDKRKHFRLVGSDQDHSSNMNENVADGNAVSDSSSESEISGQMGTGDSAEDPNPNLNLSPKFDELAAFTEEQLEELLLVKLDLVCNEAIDKLGCLGYDEDVALKAVLSNGYWHGEMNVMDNIIENCLLYLDSWNGVLPENHEPRFSDLRQLVEFTLAGMVCSLQQAKPHFSRGDAMWCLLISKLHVGRASSLSPPKENGYGSLSVSGGGNVAGGANGPVGFQSAMYRFHPGSGFKNGSPNECSPDACLRMEVKYPKTFTITPSMKTLLERNVSIISSEVRANSKDLQNQACLGSLKIGDSSGLTETGSKESQNFMNDDAIGSVLSKFHDLQIQSTETGHVQNDQTDTILSLMHQIKDIETQVKERKEWAHQKAIQAARKLCNDLAELKRLRIESEEAKLLKMGKQAIEDSTMKKLADVENALRNARGQLYRTNSAVRKLENENAEIRADIEAYKLSASESEKTYMEVTKREKKLLKKISALEKQRSKLKDDIAAEIHKSSDLENQLAQAEAGLKEAEVKWRQEQSAKDQALAQMEEARRLKEAAEASNKRRLEALRLEIDTDFQRHTDDLHRLEQELAQLRAPEQTSGQSHDLSLLGLDGLDDHADGEHRRCILCMEGESSVVFLPCAHQVLCVECNNSYGGATCPCCQLPIQQRIRIFGVT